MPPATDSPGESRAWVSIGLAVLCVWVWIWQLALGGAFAERAAYAFGLVPAVLTGHGALPPELAILLPPFTLVTALFLHHDAIQLGTNLACLAGFGGAVEGTMTRRRFAVFVVACGVFAALLQTAAIPRATTPVIGMNGTVAGLLAAYCLLYPRAVFALGAVVRGVPVRYLVIVWFVLNATGVITGTAEPAWPTLAGGATCGAILVVFLKQRHVALFR